MGTVNLAKNKKGGKGGGYRTYRVFGGVQDLTYPTLVASSGTATTTLPRPVSTATANDNEKKAFGDMGNRGEARQRPRQCN